jgi:hemoglobin/transferrin/lactoferrin receptor protein
MESQRLHRGSAELRLARCITALLGVAAAAAALADGPAGPPVLEEIRVLGKRAEPLAKAAATVTVLDREALEATLAGDLRGLLRYEPAITVGADPHRFGNAGPSLRGLGGNRVLLETDGVPVPSFYAVGSVSNTGRRFAETDLIERIEILHGAASSLYGSDALAGVIATTTHDPRSLLEEDGAYAARLQSGYSSVDEGRHAALTLAARQRDVAAMLALGRREAGAVDIASATAEPNPREATGDFAFLRTVHDGSERPLRLTLAWDRQRVETEVDSLLLSPGAFANTVEMNADDGYETRRVILDQPAAAWGGAEHLEWRLWWQDMTVRQHTVEERRAAPPRTPPLLVERTFTYTEEMAGGELTLAHTLQAASGSHRLVGGLELTASRITEQRDGRQTNLLTGTPGNVLLGETMPVRDFPRSEVAKLGVYLQDEFRPGQSAFSIIPALRADVYRLRPLADPLYAEDNPAEAPVSVEQVSVSPKLGLSWQLREDLTAWAQYAHGFRAPPFEDVNIGLDIPQFNIRALPNPDLRPEESDSLELGLRLAGGIVSGSASVFYSRYEDFIESRVRIGTDPGTGTILFQSRNLARAEVRGAEAMLEADLSRALGLSPGWSTRLAAAYARGDDLERRQPLNSIEPLRGVVALRYDAPGGRVGADLALTAATGQDRVADGPVPVARPGGFAVLDLTGYWRITAKVTVRAGIMNLTDRSYFEWSDVRGRAADDPLLEQYRRPGRHGSITITASF